MNQADRRRDAPALTGIRGVAAVYVVLHHYFGDNKFSTPEKTVLTHGYLSVDLFFVLSGFVMALTYQHMFRQQFSIPVYLQFIGRRIARIYPIYIIATFAALVIILCGLNGTIKADMSSPIGWTGKFLLNAILVQGWGIAGSINDVAWSLSAEWAAYVVFPALLIACLFRTAFTAWLSGILSVAIILALCLTPAFRNEPMGLLDLTTHRHAVTVLRCLPEFSLGLLAYRLSSEAVGGFLRVNRFATPAISLLIIALLCIPKTDFFIVLLIPPMVIGLDSGSVHVTGKLLSSPIADGLGKLSYSVYLIHPLFFWMIGFSERKLISFSFYERHLTGGFLALGLTFMFSYLSYSFIEIPGRRVIRNRLEGRRKKLVRTAETEISSIG